VIEDILTNEYRQFKEDIQARVLKYNDEFKNGKHQIDSEVHKLTA
jgi:hypothetical protein